MCIFSNIHIVREQLIYANKSALSGIFILNEKRKRKWELKAIQPFLEAFNTRSSLQDLLLVQNIRLAGHRKVEEKHKMASLKKYSVLAAHVASKLLCNSFDKHLF